jgi:hypothetical protein
MADKNKLTAKVTVTVDLTVTTGCFATSRVEDIRRAVNTEAAGAVEVAFKAANVEHVSLDGFAIKASEIRSLLMEPPNA